MSYARRFLAIALFAVGLFMGSYGLGLGNAGVIAVGFAVGIIGPAVLILTAVRGSNKQWVFGTAHVHSASPPPSAGMIGRCELHLSVFATGIDGVAVRVLDPAVPVSKWPDDGATLPVEVVADNPRKVRVLWDRVITHAQAAGEDLYPEYVGPARPDPFADPFADPFEGASIDEFDDNDLPPFPPSPPPAMTSGAPVTVGSPAVGSPVVVGSPAVGPVGSPVALADAPIAPPGSPIVPPGPPVAVPGSPVAADAPVLASASVDFAPEPAPITVPPDRRPISPAPVSPAPAGSAVTAHDADVDAVDRDPDDDGRLAHAHAEPLPDDGHPDGNSDGDDDDPPVLPLPRRQKGPHLRRNPNLRRPSPRQRKADREAQGGAGGINPVYVADTFTQPPPEWPFAAPPAPMDPAPVSPAPDRPESRPEPDDSEIVSGTVEPRSGGAVSGQIVDDIGYADRSETDRMTVDRSSFRIVDVDPYELRPGGRTPSGEPAAPEQSTVDSPPVVPERSSPESGDDPFNVVPLRVQPGTVRPVPRPADATTPEATATEATDDEPDDEPGDDLRPEASAFLGAPSAGLSQLGSAGISLTLFVGELARSVAFYRDVLGLPEVDTGPNSAVLARGESRILLKRITDLKPVDRRIVHLNLEVPDVHTAYDDLRSKGVEFVHRPRVVSQGDQLELWAATFRDPDGHAIALTHWEIRR